MVVHLIDGTFELFRYFMSPSAAFDRSAPVELRAVRGVVASVLGMLEGGATHVGVATDHVIESFRNAMWPGYKTGEGIDPHVGDRKSTRLNSSHGYISYAVFCLKKKKTSYYSRTTTISSASALSGSPTLSSYKFHGCMRAQTEHITATLTQSCTDARRPPRVR